MLYIENMNERTWKTVKQLERYFKGAANHRRLAILKLVAGRPGVTLEEIAEALDCNIKTISEHSRRLVQAGLPNKKIPRPACRTFRVALRDQIYTFYADVLR